MANPVSSQLTSETSDSEADQERRRAPREEMRLALEVTESTDDLRIAGGPSTKDWGSGETRNVSQGGICFLSPMRLRPGLIRVREAGESQASDGDLELEIVRCRKTSDGLWEYGAALCSGEAAATFELAPPEFKSLYSELRGQDQPPPHGSKPPQHGAAGGECSTDIRQLVLSLREVAHWQLEMERYTNHSVRQRAGLAMAKAVVMFTGVYLIAQGVWPGAVEIWWAPVLLVGVLLIYVEEWRLLRQFQKLCTWTPTHQRQAKRDAGESSAAGGIDSAAVD